MAISKDEMFQQLAEEMAARGVGGETPVPGLPGDELMNALEHPLAMAEVEKMLEREASSVEAGEVAPDFSLGRLDGPGARVTLSEHRGTQPVALIFGSYT